jgi:hypothetical protein
VEGVGVKRVILTMGQEVLRPFLEGGEGKVVFDELYHHHRELELILGPKVEGFTLEDPVHRPLEVVGMHQGDEMADLVKAIGGVERAKLSEPQVIPVLLPSGPFACQLPGVFCQHLAEPATQLRGTLLRLVSSVEGRREEAGEEGPAQASGFLIDVRFGSLEEDVRGPDLVLIQSAVFRAEGEVPMPTPTRILEGDQEAGPTLPLPFEESDRTTAKTFQVG